jgi:hypothetical protein
MKGTGGKTYSSEISSSSYMEDWTGNPHGNNPLYSVVITSKGHFTGDNHASGIAHRSCSEYASNRRIPAHISIPRDSNVALATRAAADSNPARAHVSIPNFIFEMKDIPLLVKNRGGSILQSAGSANLNWQFGIRPLLSDLGKMLDFSGAYEKRVKEIEDLNNGVLKRRVQLEKDQEEESGSFTMESVLFFADSQYKVVTTRDIWAFCYWKPTTSFSNLRNGSKDQRNAIRRALAGLSTAQIPINVWNALPWSWLVDWFTSMGDLIQASNNSVGYLAESVVLCVHTTTEREDKLVGVPGWITSDTTWSGTKETKERFLIPPGLSAKTPFLSKGQLSILGSLYVLRK